MRTGHSNQTEHRLTVLEVKHESLADSHKELRGRVSKIEGRPPLMQPRDWLMTLVGVGTVLAAIAGRVSWDKAQALLELLSKN